MNAEFQSPAASAVPEAEPTTTVMPVPLWLIMATFLLLLWGAVFFDRNGAWFHPKIYAPYRSVEELTAFQAGNPTDLIPRGKIVFEMTCALCHNPDGMGKPNQAPPLAGSEWVNAKSPNRIMRIPLVGLAGPIKVKDQEWNLSMPAMGASLSDSDVAATLSYIRNAWGNKGSFVTPEQIKAVRAELGNRTQPVTVEELMKVPE